MLVHVADNCTLNMTAVDSVMIRQKKIVTYPNKTLFSKGKESITYENVVEIDYKNGDGQRASFKYDCKDDMKTAKEIKKRILEQAKEIENAGATQALEAALRDS